MPLVRIDHPPGKPDTYHSALSRGVHEAMVATFGVPDDDRFQITCNDTRTLDQKKALYVAIADNLATSAKVRRADIVISLVEVEEGELLVRKRTGAVCRLTRAPSSRPSWPTKTGRR